MKRLKFVLTGTIIVLIILGIYLLNITKVEPGQVWRYTSSDPYDKYVVTNRVIDSKDGYVLFVRNNIDTMSEPIRIFLYNAELIQPK